MLRLVFRILSILALAAAIAGGLLVLLLDAARFARLGVHIPFRSGAALVAAGSSYACLQFARPGILRDRLLALSVSLGFILWGIEQFVPDPAAAALIDDAVVIIFVTDLSLVIWKNLKS